VVCRLCRFDRNEPDQQHTRYGFEFQRKGTLNELRNEIVDSAGINRFVIVEISYCGMTRILKNNNPLSILPNQEDSLYAVELDKEVYGREKRSDGEIVLIVSNVEKKDRCNRR